MSGVLDISDNFDIFIRNVLRVWRIEQDRGEMKEKDMWKFSTVTIKFYNFL